MKEARKKLKDLKKDRDRILSQLDSLKLAEFEIKKEMQEEEQLFFGISDSGTSDDEESNGQWWD